MWHEIMTALLGLQQYYNPAQRPLSYKLSLPYQSKAFSCYQSQHCIAQSQQPWRLSNQPSSEALILGNPPHLLDFNANTPLNFFVNHLCHSVNTTLIRSSVLKCCLRQMLSRKLSQTLNQLSIVHVWQVTQSLTTYHANLVAPPKPNHTKHIDQVHPIAAIREPTTKGYIRLTRTC